MGRPWSQVGRCLCRAGSLLGPALPTRSDLLAEITIAARAYYTQTSDFPLTATDFLDWLDSLPAARRADVLARGFLTSQAEPDFLRWCLELRGYSVRASMADQLSVAAYSMWFTHCQFNGGLPIHCISR